MYFVKFFLIIVLSFVSFLRAKKPKESTKENKERRNISTSSLRSAVQTRRVNPHFLASQTPFGQTVLGFAKFVSLL